MSVSNQTMTNEALERQRRVRRSALWLAALALAFYAGYILMSVSGARG